MFASIKPTNREIAAKLPGDAIVPNAAVTMNRAFTLPATPAAVWPWFVQLGKNRAGWYFTYRAQYLIFPKQRGIWRIDPKLQDLKIGKIIDDWGGKDATFEVAILEPEKAIVYKSTRGTTNLSWAIILRPDGKNTRVHLRLRLSPVKFKWLAETFGGFFDAATVAALAAGLRERLS